MFAPAAAHTPPGKPNLAAQPVPLTLPADPGHPAIVVTPIALTVRVAGELLWLPVAFWTVHLNWSPPMAKVVPLTTRVDVSVPP